MTRRQFERWQTFALAMAQDGFARMTPARRERLKDAVDGFFFELDSQGTWRQMKSWDHSEPGSTDYACDWVSDLFGEHWHEKPYGRNGLEGYGRFYGQISCCLRAGMDVAAEPSAGVIGFTVGDLRRMFGGRVPLWVSRQYRGGLAKLPDNTSIGL